MRFSGCRFCAAPNSTTTHYVCLVRTNGASPQLWGSAHARTRPAFYSSADSKEAVLSAGRIPRSTKSVLAPAAILPAEPIPMLVGLP